MSGIAEVVPDDLGIWAHVNAVYAGEAVVCKEYLINIIRNTLRALIASM